MEYKLISVFEINELDEVEIDELCGFRYKTQRIW
jgi:hypothetical protein